MFSKVDISETDLYQAFPNIKQTIGVKLENKITEFYTKLSHNLETLEQQKEDVLNLCDKCERQNVIISNFRGEKVVQNERRDFSLNVLNPNSGRL